LLLEVVQACTSPAGVAQRNFPLKAASEAVAIAVDFKKLRRVPDRMDSP